MRCSSPLTPPPALAHPGRAVSPSFLHSFPLRAGRPGVGVGQAGGVLALWGAFSWGSPARRLPALGTEGSPWRTLDGAPDHRIISVQWGWGEHTLRGWERRGRAQGPLRLPAGSLLCGEAPPAWLSAASGLEVVRGKGTEPLLLAFPLFVVSWRAIGCRL